MQLRDAAVGYGGIAVQSRLTFEVRRGEIVMEHLRKLDDVAYVRFASVYRNFRETRDFEALIGELEGDEKNS